MAIKDVTRAVITEGEIKTTVGRIFADGIILTNTYTIVSIGNNICNALGMDAGDWEGATLFDLTGPTLQRETLQDLLSTGYFEGHPLTLKHPLGGDIRFEVSGFYLGLIADIDDMIVLKLQRNTYDTAAFRERLLRAAELDDFIYATSHSLRGPLATLKGLINLLKLPASSDTGFIVEKMTYYADRLDDRLHKMIYLAESDKFDQWGNDCTTLESILTKFQHGEYADEATTPVRISMTPGPEHGCVKNGRLVLQLLRNVHAFLLRSGVHEEKVALQATCSDLNLVFNFTAPTQHLSKEKVKKIDVVNFGYTDILSDPDYIEIYSAKKIIFRLQGSLKVSLEDNTMRVWITIPITP